jgi:hypothetical protein
MQGPVPWALTTDVASKPWEPDNGGPLLEVLPSLGRWERLNKCHSGV